jgi:hypothetical protein
MGGNNRFPLPALAGTGFVGMTEKIAIATLLMVALHDLYIFFGFRPEGISIFCFKYFFHCPNVFLFSFGN